MSPKLADLASMVLSLVERLAEAVIRRAAEKHPEITHNAVVDLLREHEDEIAGVVMNLALAKLAERAHAVVVEFDDAERRGRARAVSYRAPDNDDDKTPRMKPDNGGGK